MSQMFFFFHVKTSLIPSILNIKMAKNAWRDWESSISTLLSHKVDNHAPSHLLKYHESDVSCGTKIIA